MEYQIVKGSEEKLHVFERRMNSFIRDGWEPIGGIACVGKGLYRQAMIRRDDGIRYRKVSAPPGIADDMPDQELTFPDHPVMPSLRDIEFED
jgi:hypothetical protein